ncbi:MAG: hypothetical protein AB7O38_03920 [Pirellulaceae bacterium]
MNNATDNGRPQGSLRQGLGTESRAVGKDRTSQKPVGAGPAVTEPRLGFATMARLATLLIGLGTTSSAAVELCRRRLVREARTEFLGGITVMVVDGDPPDNIDFEHFVQLMDGARGAFGFGTNPAAGGIEIVARNRPVLHSALMYKMEQLIRGGGAITPLIGPQSAMRIGIVYGPGGVSSSTGQVMEELVEAAGRQLGIAGLYVDHLMIGPEICTRATDRKVAPYQRRFIKSNFSQSLQRLMERFADAAGPAEQRREDRGRSVSLVDQTNLAGLSIPTMAEFTRMLGDCLFHRYATKAGKEADARYVDAEGTGQHHGPDKNE